MPDLTVAERDPLWTDATAQDLRLESHHVRHDPAPLVGPELISTIPMEIWILCRDLFLGCDLHT